MVLQEETIFADGSWLIGCKKWIRVIATKTNLGRCLRISFLTMIQLSQRSSLIPHVHTLYHHTPSPSPSPRQTHAPPKVSYLWHTCTCVVCDKCVR